MSSSSTTNFDQNLPERYELVYSEDQIAETISRLALEISTWVTDWQTHTKQDVVCVPVMRGAFFFAADLMRKLPGSLELAPITTSSYSSIQNNTPYLSVQVDVRGIEVQDRAVLVVDDICDSGRTLAVLSEKLQLAGAKSVESVVLVHRKVEQLLYKPKWAGFEYSGPEWFVGYGMEDAGRWRNLKSVYKINV